LRVFVNLAGEKSLAERAEWHEADSEFFERGDNLRLRLTPKQGVFALQGGYLLNCVGAPDSIRTGFRKAEMFHLAGLNQFLHRTGHVIDGHVLVNAMLIEQINDIG